MKLKLLIAAALLSGIGQNAIAGMSTAQCGGVTYSCCSPNKNSSSAWVTGNACPKGQQATASCSLPNGCS